MNTCQGIFHRSSALKPYARRLTLAALLGVVSTIMGCASVEPSVYANEKPVFDLQSYFNGTVDAWGIFTDRSGKVVKRFKVVMLCSWQGEGEQAVGTLDEHFTYSDGTKEQRVWTLRKGADGKFIGTASDVIGEASGQVAGNALQWRYTLALPVDGKTYHVQFNDWMYLMDEQVMINKAVMSKFGFRLGEVTLSFMKRGV